MSDSTTQERGRRGEDQRDDRQLYVGIGASAGGVQALQRFLEHTPADTGMSFIVLIHHAPSYESSLKEILQRCTTMPVREVARSVRIKPDQVYVIPPSKNVALEDGLLQVSARDPGATSNGRIDLLFRALAEAEGERTTCIVLSGVGADGALALARVKELGGLVMVQEPADAEHEGMPRSAIGTGLADYVLPVADLPGRLVGHWTELRVRQRADGDGRGEAAIRAETLRELFAILRSHTGHNFSVYKRSTLIRRVERRMQVNSSATVTDYVALLRRNPVEVRALLRDLLISVTNFFRDREAWEILGRDVIPTIVNSKESTDTVRVWVAGCANGAEAYSVAILLHEYARTLEHPPKLQVFATDMDEQAIAVARQGSYPDTIEADISPERLGRYFVKETGHYQVVPELRDMVLFAVQDVLRDPPFSRLDLVTCRNLLIYLNRDAQEQLLTLFHFALRPGSYLFLGTSESTDTVPDLYAPFSKAGHIYLRRMVIGGPHELPAVPVSEPDLRAGEAAGGRPQHTRAAALGELHQEMLEQYAPPSVMVNGEYDILHLSNRAGRYLRFDGGEPSINLLKVVQPELRAELRSALFRAVQGKSNETRRIKVHLGGEDRYVRVLVSPVERPAALRGNVLVLFDEFDEAGLSAAEGESGGAGDAVANQLEQELQQVRNELRVTIEQYETSTEELKASNEELQAMNEELRSATEELETSKEELQAVNEELMTVNQELKSKITELSHANSDLQNLISSTDIGTIFLDRELRLKRYTPHVERLYNLIPSDLNRPLAHITHKLTYGELGQDAADVLRTLLRREREVRTNSGQWYMVRLLPYRTLEDKIDGVVINFVDITDRKAYEEKLQKANEQLELTVGERTAELSGVNEALRREVSERAQAADRSRELARQMIAAQEAERQSISRELHDELGQTLTALRLKLDLAARKDGRELAGLVEDARSIVAEMAIRVREISFQLRPPVLDDMGLLPALQDLIERYRSQMGMQVDFRQSGLKGQLPSDVETTVYRTVQEGLTNVARHAGVREAIVRVAATSANVSVHIEDHGEGFDPDSLPESLSGSGLSGMRERARLLGGELVVEAQPGHGTQLHLDIPRDSRERDET